MRLTLSLLALFFLGGSALAGTHKIVEALLYGDVAQVRTWLEQGGKPNKRIRGKDTPLLLAAEGGHLAIIDLLCNHGADMGTRGRDKDTALIRAVSMGRVAAAESLLARGMYPDETNKMGRTALIQAAETNESSIIRRLLDAGANLDKTDYRDNTALMVAVKHSQVAAASLLINAGAEKQARDYLGMHAQEFAGHLNHRELEGLFDGTSYDTGEPELFRAIAARDNSRMVALLDSGQELDLINGYGETPLVFAARHGLRDQAALLIERGANLKQHDGYGITPLLAAVKGGRTETVALLLRSGADVNQANPKGWLALEWANKLADAPIAQLLIRNGAIGPRGRKSKSKRGRNLEQTRVARLMDKALGGPVSRVRIPAVGDPGITPPRQIMQVTPLYPKHAEKARYSGVVVLSGVFGADGQIHDIQVLRGFYNWQYGFEIEAIKAFSGWRFVPGKAAGKKTDLRAIVNISFGQPSPDLNDPRNRSRNGIFDIP